MSIKDVKPTGATAPYASPEVLRSLMLQFEGAKDDEEGVMIVGCLADMWSLGCIMYEMLTGDKPFLPEDDSFLSRKAPSNVRRIFHSQWLMFDAFAEAQRDWVGSSSKHHMSCAVVCTQTYSVMHSRLAGHGSMCFKSRPARCIYCRPHLAS